MAVFNIGGKRPNSEKELEDEMEKWLLDYKFMTSDYELQYPRVIRQFSVKPINRRSDIVLYFSKRKIVNIELKITGYEEVLRQAIDHLQWVHYSYICMPTCVHLPYWFHSKVLENNIGLILYHNGYFIEAIKSYCNSAPRRDLRLTKQMSQIIESKYEEREENIQARKQQEEIDRRISENWAKFNKRTRNNEF